MIKVIVKREVQEQHVIDLTILLKRLRSLTIDQEGYITGETLKRIDRPDEMLVISTWKSIEAWNNWYDNDKRRIIQKEIDELLGEKTYYAVYEA